MSASIYYEAIRAAPLRRQEKTVVDGLVEKYSVDRKIENYLRGGKGLNWESFGFFESKERNVVLNGSTKLPDNTEEALWVGIQHWCRLLSELRRAIPDATWSVQVEDHEIQWDPKAMRYDPSK